MLSVENPPPDFSSCVKTSTPISNDSVTTTPPPSASPPELFVLPAEKDQLNTSFSIRDYAFTARNKDIAASWPFSPKHLRLCLENGVKDLLPPFQRLDSLRNTRRCLVECAVENVISNSEEKLLRIDQLVSSGSSSVNSRCDDELAEGYVGLDPSLAGGEKDLEYEVEPASTSKLPASVVADGLEVGAPAEGAIQFQASNKRSRLAAKLGSNAVHKSSTEDIASTSEASLMASKTCPVCQTFSSSSNTTLNAHIDQCLSIKWLENSKLTKPRIKPRKMKLMADIYATAQHCTLQDLDRRNGTNWAVEMNMLPKVSNATAEGKTDQTTSSTRNQSRVNDGAVYVDANGTKIRILSRSYDALVGLGARDELKIKRPPKKYEGKRFISSSKKRCLVKHHKYVKLNPRKSPLKAFSPEVAEQETGDRAANVMHEEGKQLAPLFTDHERKKSYDSVKLRKWACSKSTSLLKNSKAKLSHQHSEYELQATKDLPAESDPLYVAGGSTVRIQSMRDSSSPEHCGVSAKTSRRKDMLSHQAGFNDMNGTPGRKRGGSPLFRDPLCGSVESSLQSKALVTSRSSADEISRDETEVDIHTGAMDIGNASGASSGGFCAFSSEGITLSSLRETVCLPSQTSNPACQSKANQPSPALKRCNANTVGEELVAWPAEMLLKSDSVQDYSENSCKRSEISNSLCRRSILKIQDRQGLGSIYPKGVPTTSEVPRSAHCCHDPGEVGKNDFSDRVAGGIQGCMNSAVKEIPNDGLDFFTDTTSGAATNLSRSNYGTELCKLASAITSPFGAQQSNEEYHGHMFRVETSPPILGSSSIDDPVMFCANEIGIELMEPESGDRDSKLGQGSFLVVDPIPIPGPPGSYLPSPRDMESEVLQGNSSLTTSRIQCSYDPCEIADVNSSDSPVSALSTISNFKEAKSVFNKTELCMELHSVRDKVCSGFPSMSTGYAMENAASFSQVTRYGNKWGVLDEDSSQGGIMLQGEGALRVQYDNQPCSCSWKEGISWDASLTCQEPHLLEQQWITSLSLPAIGKQKRPKFETEADSLKYKEMSSLSDCSRTACEAAAASPQATTPKALVTNASHILSPSTQVLRLMGKNLMVVNNVEVEGVRLLDQPSLNEFENMHASTVSGVSSGSLHQHCICDAGSLVHSEHADVMMTQNFAVQPPCNFDNFRTLHTPTQA